ncbi:hypothetical protein ACTHGU_09915 [Chitinophagaceae bacterium MMS25-I14]
MKPAYAIRFPYFFCFFLLIACKASAAQKDSVIVLKEYCIYRGDTVNRLDRDCKRTGKWLFFRIDTIRHVIITEDCYWIKKGKTHCVPNVIHNDGINYKHIATGYYTHGKKNGNWQFSGDTFHTLSLLIDYTDGAVRWPVLFINGDCIIASANAAGDSIAWNNFSQKGKSGKRSVEQLKDFAYWEGRIYYINFPFKPDIWKPEE